MGSAVDDGSSSIIFRSHDNSILVVDIPRSLEEAQVLPSQQLPRRRIYSVSPTTAPYRTPEPKVHDRCINPNQSPAAQLAELMTTATVHSALRDLQSFLPNGPFLLPRLLRPEAPLVSVPEPSPPPIVPDKAEALHGSIHDLRDRFDVSAPRFDVLVLDPPWPNRSARRKTTSDRYATVSNLAEMRSLLLQIPVVSHLAPDGLVAVWITNKPSINDFLTGHAGLFDVWGLEVVAEWIWVKITSSGEPIYDVDSAWRKPWEKLVIAQRKGSPRPERLMPHVLFAVPDIHSRKPNLRRLFQDVFQRDDHLGLEVFARNLTANWWSWGDECLLFQQPEHWSQ